MTETIRLKKSDRIYIEVGDGNSYLLTVHDFKLGQGIRIEPIGASYIPICKSLAERQDLVDDQKNIE